MCRRGRESTTRHRASRAKPGASAQLVRFPSPVENFFTPLPRSASAGHVFRIYAPILFHGSFSLCNLYTVRLSVFIELVLRHFHQPRFPRAARCGFFLEWAQIAQGVGYEGIRWTRGFTWFWLPERNTLRPRVNRVVLLCLSVRLKSPSSALGVCPDLL
jgi:hypothetical protein